MLGTYLGQSTKKRKSLIIENNRNWSESLNRLRKCLFKNPFNKLVANWFEFEKIVMLRQIIIVVLCF